MWRLKSVQTGGKLFAKVVNAEFAHTFAPLCYWMCKNSAFTTLAQILPLVLHLRTPLHMSKFDANPFYFVQWEVKRSWLSFNFTTFIRLQ